VREVFHGSVTYPSVPLETVEWSRFDFVSVDLYRDARLRDRFSEILRRYFACDRPVAITEFGCCTYRGTADAGGRGFAILDYSVSARDSTPPRLNGDYLRDESEQARELTEMLTIFDHAGIDATFMMTFVAPLNPCSDDPMYDLDIASYSLVKSYGGRLGPLGSAYPEAPLGPGAARHHLPGHAMGAKEVVQGRRGLLRRERCPAPIVIGAAVKH
jgi:hypothetical protein